MVFANELDVDGQTHTRHDNIVHAIRQDGATAQHLKLASFKGDQRSYRGQAASHVGAAVLAHVACIVCLQTNDVHGN